ERDTGAIGQRDCRVGSERLGGHARLQHAEGDGGWSAVGVQTGQEHGAGAVFGKAAGGVGEVAGLVAQCGGNRQVGIGIGGDIGDGKRGVGAQVIAVLVRCRRGGGDRGGRAAARRDVAAERQRLKV